MLKFLPGILLLQMITIGLAQMAPAGLKNGDWLRLAVPILITGFLTAFWFGAVAARQRKDEISRLKEHHAKERETIRVNAERAKTRLIRESHKMTGRAVRRSSRRGAIKVGWVLAGAAGLGGLLALTQFMTWGLLTLAAGGGALGGYFLRIRQEKGRCRQGANAPDTRHINGPRPPETGQVPRIEPP